MVLLRSIAVHRIPRAGKTRLGESIFSYSGQLHVENLNLLLQFDEVPNNALSESGAQDGLIVVAGVKVFKEKLYVTDLLEMEGHQSQKEPVRVGVEHCRRVCIVGFQVLTALVVSQPSPPPVVDGLHDKVLSDVRDSRLARA